MSLGIVNVGDKFGEWTVIADGGKDSGNRKRWVCRCSCGTERTVDAYSLKRGKTSSCRCKFARGDKHHSFKHGAATKSNRSRLYRIWVGIIGRCENANDKRYKDYGGRGIGVCDAWRRDYAAFERDMGQPPTPTHSIDRIDNDGNYEPLNCRWATPREQGRNTRANHYVIYNGRRMALVEAAELAGKNYGTVKWRINKLGMNPQRALDEPVGS